MRVRIIEVRLSASSWDSVLSVVLLEDLLDIVTLARDIFQSRLKRLHKFTVGYSIWHPGVWEWRHHNILRSVQLLALLPKQIWQHQSELILLVMQSQSISIQLLPAVTKWYNPPQLVEVRERSGWFIMDSITDSILWLRYLVFTID